MKAATEIAELALRLPRQMNLRRIVAVRGLQAVSVILAVSVGDVSTDRWLRDASISSDRGAGVASSAYVVDDNKFLART